MCQKPPSRVALSRQRRSRVNLVLKCRYIWVWKFISGISSRRAAAGLVYMANFKRGKSSRFANHRGPSVPPPKNYEPVRSARKPAGYAEIEAASQSPQDAPEFMAFVRDVVNMQPEMAPAIAEAIRQQKWKIAPNPLATIRTAAHQEARRMGIEP
jgi:hypothetical protein